MPGVDQQHSSYEPARASVPMVDYGQDLVVGSGDVALHRQPPGKGARNGTPGAIARRRPSARHATGKSTASSGPGGHGKLIPIAPQIERPDLHCSVRACPSRAHRTSRVHRGGGNHCVRVWVARRSPHVTYRSAPSEPEAAMICTSAHEGIVVSERIGRTQGGLRAGAPYTVAREA